MPYPTEARKSRLLTGTENKSDWFEVQSQSIHDDADENAFWQFRVSILPTRDNAIKAVNALQTLQQFNQPYHPQLKVFIPSLTNDLSTWDASISGGDRDQRGKEICVYMECIKRGVKPDYYDGDYPSQAYLKKLMLDMWRVLQDADVDMAYIAPSVTENVITLSNGDPTPFMYSSFKPYQRRHGILLERDYNVTNKTDPLDGLRISPQDLINNGIRPIGRDYVRVRMQLQTGRFLTQRTDKLDKLTSPFELDGPYNELLQILNKMNPAKSVLSASDEEDGPDETIDDGSVEKFKTRLEEILRNRDIVFCPFPAEITTHSDYFRICLQQLDRPEVTLAQKKDALDSLKQSIESEKIRSIQEMNDVLEAHEQVIAPHILSEQFDRNPSRFQKIYQSLVVLDQEQLAIRRDARYLESDAQAFEADVPNQRAERGFFNKHWVAIGLSALAGLAIGVGLGITMGVFTAVPTGGLSLLATPWAIAILGVGGLLIGGIAGIIGCVGYDLYQIYKNNHVVAYRETGTYQRINDELSMDLHSEMRPWNYPDTKKPNEQVFSSADFQQGKKGAFFDSPGKVSGAPLTQDLETGTDLKTDTQAPDQKSLTDSPAEYHAGLQHAR